MKNRLGFSAAFSVGLAIGACIQAYGATVMENGVPVQVSTLITGSRSSKPRNNRLARATAVVYN